MPGADNNAAAKIMDDIFFITLNSFFTMDGKLG